MGEIALAPSLIYPPPSDTTKRSPGEFLERKFAQLNMLPTSSAYELIYALNPGLKDLKQVSADYQLVIPPIPKMTKETQRSFAEKFKLDDSKDEHLQQVLMDSINYCKKLYKDFQLTVNMDYSDNAARDTTRTVLRYLLNDIEDYERELKRTKRAKAIELVKLINSCCIILNQCLENKAVSQENSFHLKHIGLQLSLVLPSEKSRRYYMSSEAASSTQEYESNRYIDENRGYGPSAFGETTGYEMPPQYDFDNNQALRAFNIVIYLSKDGRVISEGAEVEKRFRVICYPPALKSIEATRRECESPATYSYITLQNAPYEFMIFDVRTGKQMKFVRNNSDTEIISTEDAFRQFAKGLLGVNQFQIPFYIKE